jgi:hypothetical protein
MMKLFNENYMWFDNVPMWFVIDRSDSNMDVFCNW